MKQPLKMLIAIVVCGCLLALVVFIASATRGNLLVVLPAAASAAYLMFLAVYWAIRD